MISSQPRPFCAERTAPLRNCGHRRQGFLGLGGFAAHDAQIAIRKFGRIRGGVKPGFEIVRAGDAQAVFVDCSRMLRAADKRMDLSDARQMRGVETAD